MAVKGATSRPPRIAVSAVPRPIQTGYGPDRGDTITTGMTAGVVRAGGVPLLLPVVDPELAAVQLAGIDGLILAGGQDLALPLPGVADAERWIDPARDRHELALWREAKRRGMPVLGICRGAQLINHAEGGPLITDLDGHDAGAGYADPATFHPLTVAPDSLLATVTDGEPSEPAEPAWPDASAARGGTGRLAVNTIHHQAVAEPAPGLRVVARADDGTIEAIEAASGQPDRPPGDGGALPPWLIAVQWHPELMLDHPGGQPLFDALAAAARRP